MRKILLTLLTTLLCSVTAWTATETLTWSGTSLTGSGGTNTSSGTAAPVNGDTYKAGTLSISSSTIATESKKHSTDSYWEDFTCSGCATEAGAPDPTATARIEFPITINSGYSFTVSSVSFNLVQQGGGGPAVHVFLVQGSTATWIGYTTPASPKSITGLSTEFSAGSAKLVFVLGLASNLTNGRGFKFSSISISGTSAVAGGGSSYSITYNCDGGTVCPSTVASATALPNPLPSGLTKSGYAFAGWFTDADKTVAAVAGASIAANTTLYAKWTPTYTVTYNGNGNTGGTAPSDASSPYTAGSNVTVLGNTGSLVKTGYTFDGWNTADDGSGTNYAVGATISSIAANTTLYAKWVEDSCTDPVLTISLN